MDEPRSGTAPAGDASRHLRPGLIDRLRLAASFLTILPVAPATQMPADAVSRACGLFPLVGAAIGLLLAVEDFLLGRLLAPALTSMLVVASLSLITGAVHLDGLADTADALGARGERERAMAILHDSRIGSFGAVALILDLGIKCAAIVSLSRAHRLVALALAPPLARWAMIAVSYRLKYLRESGAGSFLNPADEAFNLRLASVTVLICLALAWRWLDRWMLLSVAAALLVAVIAARRLYWRWLGGYTGDLLGAAGELAETLILVVFAA